MTRSTIPALPKEIQIGRHRGLGSRLRLSSDVLTRIPFRPVRERELQNAFAAGDDKNYSLLRSCVKTSNEWRAGEMPRFGGQHWPIERGDRGDGRRVNL